MKKGIMVLRPGRGGIITAHSPRELAEQGVAIHPPSLNETWGKGAADSYMKARGLSAQARREMRRYWSNNSQTERE